MASWHRAGPCSRLQLRLSCSPMIFLIMNSDVSVFNCFHCFSFEFSIFLKRHIRSTEKHLTAFSSSFPFPGLDDAELLRLGVSRLARSLAGQPRTRSASGPPVCWASVCSFFFAEMLRRDCCRERDLASSLELESVHFKFRFFAGEISHWCDYLLEN